MKRLINILDIIGDESCLSVAKHELLLDNAPELSAFPVEYEMHYLDGVPDVVTPEPISVGVLCLVAVNDALIKLNDFSMQGYEADCIIEAIKQDAIAYEEKNWHLLFADDIFEKSCLEDENYEEEL